VSDDTHELEPEEQPEIMPQVEPVPMIPDVGHAEKRGLDPADVNLERY
jgi:hypothetical protein